MSFEIAPPPITVIGTRQRRLNTKIEPHQESSKNLMSMGGLEPPRISPHAPQTCTSTIPPHRLINSLCMTTLHYFIIKFNFFATNCFIFNWQYPSLAFGLNLVHPPKGYFS